MDEQRAPEHHPCTDEEMTGWHQVVGAGGENTGEPVITLPDGLGFLVPEGKQMVIQAHYINTTGETQRYHDEVTLNLVEPERPAGYDYDAIIEWWFQDGQQMRQSIADRRITAVLPVLHQTVCGFTASVFLPTRVSHRRP